MSTRAEPSLVSAPGARAAQAGAPNVVPVSRELLADLETPISAYLRLRDLPSSFLLDSVEGPAQVARFSVLGGDPRLVLECDGAEVRVLRPDGDRGRARAPARDARALSRPLPRRAGPGAAPVHRRLPRLLRVRRRAPVGAAPRPAARRSRPPRLPPGAHGHRRRLRPPEPHAPHHRQRVPRRGRGRRERARRGRASGSTRSSTGSGAPGPRSRRRCRSRSRPGRTGRPRPTARPWSGRRSTSAPATSTR